MRFLHPLRQRRADPSGRNPVLLSPGRCKAGQFPRLAFETVVCEVSAVLRSGSAPDDLAQSLRRTGLCWGISCSVCCRCRSKAGHVTAKDYLQNGLRVRLLSVIIIEIKQGLRQERPYIKWRKPKAPDRGNPLINQDFLRRCRDI